MARIPGGKSALIEAKAVDGAYPLYGEVIVTEPKDAGPIWRKPGVIVAERSLLERLNVGVGSTALDRGCHRDHRRHPRHPARPARRPPRLWPAGADVARHARPHRACPAREPDPLDLPLEASGRAAATTGWRSTPRGSPSRPSSPKAALPSPIGPIPRPRSAARSSASPSSSASSGLAALLLGGIGVGNAIGSYMAKKRQVIATFKTLGALEPARARRLSHPGADARRSRHRPRARARRAHPCFAVGDLWQRPAHRARRRAASSVAADRCRRRPPHHAALRASAAWAAPASCRRQC